MSNEPEVASRGGLEQVAVDTCTCTSSLDEPTSAHSTPDGSTLPLAFASDLVSLLHEAVIVTDSAGQIVFANGSAERIFGHCRADLWGAPIEHLVPHEFRSRHPALMARFGAGDTNARFMGQRQAVVALHRDGHRIPVEISITSVSTPEGPLFAAIVRDLSDLEREQAARRISEASYRMLFQEALEGILEMSLDWAVKDANPAALQMFAAAPGLDWARRRPRERVVDRDALEALQRTLRDTGVARQFELQLRRFDGSTFWGSLTAQVVRGTAGNDAVIRLRIVDVSKRIAAEQARRDSEARFRSVLEHIEDAVVVLDGDRRVTYASPSAERLLGHIPVVSCRLGVAEWKPHVHPDDVWMLEALRAGRERTVNLDLRILDRQREYINVSLHWEDLRDDTAVRGFVLHVRDVTAQRRAEATLAYNGLHDQLTGLANRALLADRLALALADIGRSSSGVAVLFIDLDHFKFVNDSMGHGAGDVVLRTVAERLNSLVRGVDTVARFGGDEFVVVVRTAHHDETSANATEQVSMLSAIAQRILDVVSVPMDVDGRTTTMTASIGIAMCADPAVDGAALLADADAALYLAKGSGRNQAAFFDQRMRRSAEERMHIERNLRVAIEQDQLRLVYQPIVELDSGGVLGFEALLRWELPDGTVMHPEQFLGVAEETGLIEPISRYVLDSATRMLAQLQAGAARSPYIAINTTSRQLSSSGFTDEVSNALSRANADPGGLVLEITEQNAIVNTAACRDTLHALRQVGVRIALDDFGTGHSALAYIHKFPLDMIKIDRSFVSGTDSGKASTEALIDTVVAMARILGLQLIAEGVETREQLDRLVAAGCEAGQGWGIARELPADHVPRWLVAH